MATQVLRPHTAYGRLESSMDYMDTDIKVGADLITPGFKQHLEKYYVTASPEDKARCLELLTSLELAEAAKTVQPENYSRTKATIPQSTQAFKRPRSAVPYQKQTMEMKPDLRNPYLSSYKFAYTGYPGPSAQADRPRTSQAFQNSYSLSGPIGVSTYQADMNRVGENSDKYGRSVARTEVGNNPQPLQSFMVWKFPRCPPKPPKMTQVGEKKLEEVLRGQVMSTYQKDYLGIPQGWQMKSAFGDQDDWKTKARYSLDSSMRSSYQKPQQHMRPELNCNTKRYACNKTKNMPAHGGVPNASSRLMDIRTRTTYEREYCAGQQGVIPVRDLGRHYGGQSLAKHYNTVDDKDKEAVGRMMWSLDVAPPTTPPESNTSSRNSSRRRLYIPSTACVASPQPSSYSEYIDIPN